MASGLYWWIGNGSHVNVWIDRWLPDQQGGKLWSPPISSSMDINMDGLMDEFGWGEDVITATFLPFEAKQILNVLIS